MNESQNNSEIHHLNNSHTYNQVNNQETNIADGETMLISKNQSKTDNNPKDSNSCLLISQSNLYNPVAASENKTDLRVGELFRSQWVEEQLAKKSVCSSTQYMDSEYATGNNNDSQKHPKNVELNQMPDCGNSQQDMVMRFFKAHEISNEANSATSYRRGSARMDPTSSKQNDFNEGTFTYKSKATPQRSGRLSHRFKPEEMMFESNFKKKKRQATQAEGEQNSPEDSAGIDQKVRSYKKIVRTPHEVWMKGFFHILIFVNRFLFRNKLKLLYFKPQDLLDNQWNAINDLAAHNMHEGENKQQIKDNIFRSRFRIIRKVRIIYLVLRKKLKLFCMPFVFFKIKLTNICKQILDPIPVILPFYKISLLWDFIIIFFIFVNAIKIPIEIAFDNGQRLDNELSQLSKLIFLANFFVQINTAYYENGILQRNRAKIFVHFIRDRLIIDVVAYMCLWLNPFGLSSLRIVFLIKYFSFYEIIEKLAESLQLSSKYNFIVDLVTLLVEILMLCHLFACSWFMLGDYQEQNGMEPNWVSTNNIQNATILTQYITSIYFAIITIGTIGFGDIVPKSDIEKVFISIMALFTSCIFGYILTNIQNVYKEYNSKQEIYMSKLSELNNYMFSREVNPNLQQMARKYLKYVHEQNFQKGVMPSQTLSILSKFLREEIIEEIFKRSIQNIQFLSQFSQQFQQALSIKMKEVNYGPDEMIMKTQCYQPPQLYYILKGRVEVSLDQSKQKGIQAGQYEENKPFFEYKSGDVFGLYEFVTQSHSSTVNAKSLGITTIHQISLADFIYVINQFSIDKEKYLELKDKLVLNQNNTCARVFCYSCKSSQHLLKDCPIFFYKPVKQKIITQFNYQQELDKKQIQRSSNRLILNALAFQYEIEDECIFFREENESELGSLIQIDSEDNFKKSKTATKKFSQDTQSLNIEKKTQSRLSASMSRLSQINNSTMNNIVPPSPGVLVQFAMEPKIIEEKEEDSKFDVFSEKKRKSNAKSKSSSLASIKQSKDKEESLRKVEDLTPSSSSNSSSQSASHSSSEDSSSSSKKSKTRQKKVQVNARRSLNDNGMQSNMNITRQQTRMSLQQEFKKKATLLAARTKKNWGNEEKCKTETDLNMLLVQPNVTPSQISNNLINDAKSMNNNLKANVRRAITIGQMQLVLEQMQMQNAQKAAKQLIEINDDVITETVRTFKIYMLHNNVGNVIKDYHKCKLKERMKKKKFKFSELDTIQTKLLGSRPFQ